VLMTQRRRLDHFLVEQAVAAGAEFHDGVTVQVTGTDPRGLSLKFDGREIAPEISSARTARTARLRRRSGSGHDRPRGRLRGQRALRRAVPASR
jgi:hypothetical protein